VTPVCTQLVWYHTRISRSKTKLSITTWPEEKMLLQQSQAKRKLVSRSANAQLRHDSVLRPCKLNAKHLACYWQWQRLTQGFKQATVASATQQVTLLCYIPAAVTTVLALLTKTRLYRCRAATSGIFSYCSYNNRTQPGVKVSLQVDWADA